MLNDEFMLKLKPLVFNPAWTLYLKYLEMRRHEIHESMEVCSPESLKLYQGEIKFLNSLLTLHEDVLHIDKATKTQ